MNTFLPENLDKQPFLDEAKQVLIGNRPESLFNRVGLPKSVDVRVENVEYLRGSGVYQIIFSCDPGEGWERVDSSRLVGVFSAAGYCLSYNSHADVFELVLSHDRYQTALGRWV